LGSRSVVVKPMSVAATQPPVPSRVSRVLLCDDHRLVTAGLQKLIEPPHNVVAATHSAAELLALLPNTPADCLLLDLQMPERNGLDLIPDIHGIQGDLKILVVTMHVDHYLAAACLKEGAAGFLPKDAGREELLFAVSQVLAGRRYLSPRIPKTSHRVGLATRCPGFEDLTPRREQIVLLLGAGKRPGEIAHALGISPSLVTFHLHQIMRILGTPSHSALVRLAVLLCAYRASTAEASRPTG